MTYTKFEVKNKNSKAVIPEYRLILPEAQPESLHQGDTAVAQELTQPSAVQQNPPQSTGPVFMCNQSGFDIPSDTKKITSFYTIATVLSICIFVFAGFILKYAVDNQIYAPKPLYEFYSRVAFAFTQKDLSAFSYYKPQYATQVNTDSGISNFEEAMYEKSQSEQNNDEIYEIIDSKQDTSIAVSSDTPVMSDSGKQAYPIVKSDISHFGSTQIINETSYKPDLDALKSKTVSAFANNGNVLDMSSPLVLIYHSHGTECYNPGGEFYTEDTPTRTENTQYNVVSIGRELKNILSDFGINAIHCETMHDKDDYVSSYSNSQKSVKEYLEKYPTIKYIIDIHRDSIVKQDKTKIRPVTDWGGNSAQIMLVVGTDASGNKHPNWQNNLSLALNIQDSLNKLYPTFARPINLRKSRFNQHLCDGALLLEVGSCGNTLKDAQNAIKLFAPVYAKVILQNSQK